MAAFGFFRYVYLKALVTFIRSLVLLRDSLSPRIPDSTKWRQIRIPTRDPGRFIEGRAYGPQPQTSNGKLPVLINWHGSGFVVPLFGTDHAFCSRVARETGFLVLDVDYRKAPECPYPGPIDDVEDTLRWIASEDQKELLGADANQVAVSGFSAGGNLALVAASSLRDEIQGINVPLVLAFYPVTDISINPDEKTVPNPITPIPNWLAGLFNDCYAPDKTARTNPRVSPGLADPSSYPDTVLIITCEGDNLSPEANDLAARIDAADDGRRTVIHRCLPGVPHGWDKACKEGTNAWAQREVAYSLAVETIKASLRSRG
ncbi:hypothetical protein V2G26_016597 [Clonostachys chloroleuca]